MDQSGITPGTASAQPEVTEQTIFANGNRIHLISAGDGPLVLFLHGFPETSHAWRHQLPHIASEGYTAAALDLPGYGRSSKPEQIDSYRITELVQVMVEVVTALGEDTAVIVGHDWGAPIAWTAAWTRPEVFTAVVGVGVPFGARGLWGLPSDPFGKRRPSEVGRAIAGPDKVFYQEYFQTIGLAEAEFENDVRRWLTDLYYSFSATPAITAGLSAPDFTVLDEDFSRIIPLLRETGLCMAPGTQMSDLFVKPEHLPGWLAREDLDALIASFEGSGLSGALNYYRCVDLNWELLAAFDGQPLAVPALFIGADRDGPTLWGREAIARMREVAPLSREPVIIPDCGHWIQKEQPVLFRRELVTFLAGLDSRPVDR